MIVTESTRKAPRLLALVLATVFVTGFWLPTVTAPAEASAPTRVIVIAAGSGPALM